MPREYLNPLYSYFQTTNSWILSVDLTLFYSKYLKIDSILLCPIVLNFQIFENWWCTAANYNLLQVISEDVVNQISKHMGGLF